MSVYFFIFGVSCMFTLFPHKILLLLTLECMFLSCIHLLYGSGGSLPIFFVFLMTIFLVLDSVLGVSLLIHNSRSEGPHTGLFV